MNSADEEKPAFMTDREIYCYKIMPFGLKNTGSTYQRLVHHMFEEVIQKFMEVYIDDMLVKFINAIEHIEHLRKAFTILRQYNMKLNTAKCSFRMTSKNSWDT